MPLAPPITFELEKLEDRPCDCGNHSYPTLGAPIYDADGVMGLIEVALLDHGNPYVWMAYVVTVGEEAERVWSVTQSWAGPDGIASGIVDVAKSPWHRVPEGSRGLTRAEVLALDLKNFIYWLHDRAITHPDVRAFLDRTQPPKKGLWGKLLGRA